MNDVVLNILLGVFLLAGIRIAFAVWQVHRRKFTREEEYDVAGNPKIYYFEGRTIFYRLYARAITELENGNRLVAKELLEEFIKLEPNNPQGYIGLGLYYHGDDILEAERQFQRANQIDSNLVLPLVWLGIISYQKSQFHIAIDYLEKSIKIEKNNPDPYLGLAYCYEKLNDPTNTLRHFKQYLELAPTSREAEKVRQRVIELSHGVPSGE